MAFTVIISNGSLVDYGDGDSYAVSENGVLRIAPANPRVTTQLYAPGGWLELVEAREGSDVGHTRAVIGHAAPRSTGMSTGIG